MMVTPFFDFVHLQVAMAMLHMHIVMPFIMQQQVHMPPAIISHMFCSVAAETSSSQMQVIFMPPAHFSIFIVQRTTMLMLPIGMPDIPDIIPGIMGIPGIMPVMAPIGIAVGFIIMVEFICLAPSCGSLPPLARLYESRSWDASLFAEITYINTIFIMIITTTTFAKDYCPLRRE